MIEINFSVCEIVCVYQYYCVLLGMRFMPKKDNLNRSDSQTLYVNLSDLNLNSIIGESMNDSHSLGSLQSKEREQMDNAVKEIVAGVGIVTKPVNVIKCSQADFETGRESVIQTVKDNAEAFGITDEKAISEQITIKCEQYDREHEVKGGTHQDCVKGKARTILQDRLLPALKEYNDCTKSDGLHGKGNCELETVNLNYKAVKSETTDETSDDENAEPVETEENEKTK